MRRAVEGIVGLFFVLGLWVVTATDAVPAAATGDPASCDDGATLPSCDRGGRDTYST